MKPVSIDVELMSNSALNEIFGMVRLLRRREMA